MSCTPYFGIALIFLDLASIITALETAIFSHIQNLILSSQILTLSNFQIITASIQSIFTVLAIIIGGYWTYNIYNVKREGLPRASVEHNADVLYISENRLILNIDVTIKNTGSVLLKSIAWQIIVRKILPPTEKMRRLMEMPLNDYAIELPPGDDLFIRRGSATSERIEIEPGEIDQSHYNCLVDSDVTTISIESYFKNIKKTDIGWKLTTIHHLDKSKTVGCNMQRTEMKAGVFPEKGPVGTDFEFEAWNLDGNSLVNVKIVNEGTAKIEFEKKGIKTGLSPVSSIQFKSSTEGLKLEKGAYRFEAEGFTFGGKDHAEAKFFIYEN
ncbi:MAG: hypothetical protein EHM14_08450 [Methanothrix sp.]|nr:MAG: hypothetical protein EHM14_08450 [Methanothrix sp.]